MASRVLSSRRSPRLILAAIIVLISVLSYYCTTQEVENPFTGETQRVALSVDQEIALGLQAAPKMIQQFGGEEQGQAAAQVDQIGQVLVDNTQVGDTEYQFEFHLLDDEQTINAFALPGGQVFITDALYQRLETEGQVAGVLAHEIGHVVGRHGSEQMAKAQLTQGLASAAVIAATDPDDPSSREEQQVAAAVAQLVNMNFSREHELESDRLAVRLMADAGYDPRALIRVMEVLAQDTKGQRSPEFFSTHPNPDNRIQQIEEAIAAEFPDGVPEGLTK